MFRVVCFICTIVINDKKLIALPGEKCNGYGVWLKEIARLEYKD